VMNMEMSTMTMIMLVKKISNSELRCKEIADDLREADKTILLVTLWAIMTAIAYQSGTLADHSFTVVIIIELNNSNSRLMKIGLKKRDKSSSYCQI